MWFRSVDYQSGFSPLGRSLPPLPIAGLEVLSLGGHDCDRLLCDCGSFCRRLRRQSALVHLRVDVLHENLDGDVVVRAVVPRHDDVRVAVRLDERTRKQKRGRKGVRRRAAQTEPSGHTSACACVQEHELRSGTDGSNEALVGRLDGVEVLSDDAVHLATALRNVALD